MEFLKSIVSECEPFLRKYQSPKPLVPFLFDDLMSICLALLSRYVKETVLRDAKTAKQVMEIGKIDNVEHKSLQPALSIAIGKTFIMYY